MTPDLLDREIDRLLAGLAADGASDEQAAAGALIAMAASIPPSQGRARARAAMLSAAATRSRSRLRRAFVLAPLAASMAFGGVAVASRGALPGDPLYGMRRGLQAVHVAVAIGDVSKASALLDRAERDLDDAERALSRGRESDARKALRVFDRDIASARSEIATVDAVRRETLTARADGLDRRADALRVGAADDDGIDSRRSDSGSGSGSDDVSTDDSGAESADDSGSNSGHGSGDDPREEESRSGSGGSGTQEDDRRDDSDDGSSSNSGSGSDDGESDDSKSGSGSSGSGSDD